MEDPKSASTAGVEDAEVFVSASEDDSTPQVVTPELLSALVKQVTDLSTQQRSPLLA